MNLFRVRCAFVVAALGLAQAGAIHAQQAVPAAKPVPTVKTPSIEVGRVIVLNSDDASVSVIDPVSKKEINRFEVGKEPHHLMATPDNKSLIVANAASNDLVFLNPNTGEIQKRLSNIADPYQIGFSPNQKWFVSNSLRLDRVDIYAYDGESLKLAKRIPAPSMPSHMAFTPDSKYVFITLQGSNKIMMIDLATQAVQWQMAVGSQPAGIWLTPDEKHLLVGIMGKDYVEVIDWKAQKSISRIVTGKGAHNFRPLGDKRHVLVSNRVSNTINIIDQTTLKVTGEIKVPGGPDCMELTDDGKQLWVTSRWKKQVAVVDMATLSVTEVVPVGRSPHGVYIHRRAPML